MIYKEKPHLYIFTGHFGSGKTEVSVNFAIDLKKSHPERKVALIDMDIINPFFRSADAKETLENLGIECETMTYANSNVDVPALTGRMGYLISDTTTDVILDIGGDDLGARACGYYADAIMRREHTMYFVLNTFRPFTSSTEQAMKILGEIREAARVKVDGICDNTNMLEKTTIEDLTYGVTMVDEFAKASGLPVLMHAIMPRGNAEISDFAEKNYKPSELLLMTENVKLVFGREAME